MELCLDYNEKVPLYTERDATHLLQNMDNNITLFSTDIKHQFNKIMQYNIYYFIYFRNSDFFFKVVKTLFIYI